MSPLSSGGTGPIARELGTGERVLWSGQPDPERMKQKATPTVWLSIPFSAWTALWIWETSSSARASLAAGQTPSIAEAFFPAFGLIGAALAVYVAISPWHEHAKAARTFYALTDRRALIVVEGRRREVKSVLPTEFSLERHDLPTGKGDVVFKCETTGVGIERTTTQIGFYGISNAQEVERIARELAQGAR